MSELEEHDGGGGAAGPGGAAGGGSVEALLAAAAQRIAGPVAAMLAQVAAELFDPAELEGVPAAPRARLAVLLLMVMVRPAPRAWTQGKAAAAKNLTSTGARAALGPLRGAPGVEEALDALRAAIPSADALLPQGQGPAVPGLAAGTVFEVRGVEHVSLTAQRATTYFAPFGGGIMDTAAGRALSGENSDKWQRLVAQGVLGTRGGGATTRIDLPGDEKLWRRIGGTAAARAAPPVAVGGPGFLVAVPFLARKWLLDAGVLVKAGADDFASAPGAVWGGLAAEMGDLPETKGSFLWRLVASAKEGAAQSGARAARSACEHWLPSEADLLGMWSAVGRDREHVYGAACTSGDTAVAYRVIHLLGGGPAAAAGEAPMEFGPEADARAALGGGDWAPEPRDPAALAVVAQLPHLLHAAGDRPYAGEAGAMATVRSLWAQNRMLFMPNFVDALARLPRRVWRAERPPLAFTATGATYSPGAGRATRSYLADARQVALAVRTELGSLADAIDSAVATVSFHPRIVAMKAMAAALWLFFAAGVVLTREPATVADLLAWSQSVSFEANWAEARPGGKDEAERTAPGNGEAQSPGGGGLSKRARKAQRQAERTASPSAPKDAPAFPAAGSKRERTEEGGGELGAGALPGGRRP
jgi:hypothetical protein